MQTTFRATHRAIELRSPRTLIARSAVEVARTRRRVGRRRRRRRGGGGVRLVRHRGAPQLGGQLAGRVAGRAASAPRARACAAGPRGKYPFRACASALRTAASISSVLMPANAHDFFTASIAAGVQPPPAAVFAASASERAAPTTPSA
jgi:hypothetical protein